MLSKKHIQSYRELYRKRFNKEISEEEAYEQGIALLRLVELTYTPMTEKEYEQFKVEPKVEGNPASDKGSNTTTK